MQINYWHNSVCIFLFNPLYQLLPLPQFEPVIEHHDIVHHMVLYHCPTYVMQGYDKPCFMGDEGDACFGAVAAWAVGGGVRRRPPLNSLILFLFVCFFSVYPSHFYTSTRASIVYS